MSRDRNKAKNLLNGKVKIETLPIIKPSEKSKNGPKRLLLQKGELAQIYDSDTPVKLIAYIELIKGKIRGGHYHKSRWEATYLLRGEVELTVSDVKNGKTAKARIKEGNIFFLKPGVAHIIKVIKSGHAIEFSNKRYKEKETVKYF